MPVLNARGNIVVICDEAHRSQYGTVGRLDTKTGAYVFGNAKHMRDALPNASFIGFTDTPTALEDRHTRGVFGDCVSIYDIQDAVDDKATVLIYYESRLTKLDINREEIEALNQDVEEVIEDEEDVAARETVKSKWTQLAKLVGAAAAGGSGTGLRGTLRDAHRPAGGEGDVRGDESGYLRGVV